MVSKLPDTIDGFPIEDVQNRPLNPDAETALFNAEMTGRLFSEGFSEKGVPASEQDSLKQKVRENINKKETTLQDKVRAELSNNPFILSEELDNIFKKYASAIKAENDLSSLGESFAGVMAKGNSKRQARLEAISKIRNDNELFLEAYKEIASGEFDPEAILETAQAAREVIDENNKKFRSESLESDQFVDSLTVLGSDPIEVKRNKVVARAYQLAQEVFDEAGLSDKVLAFVEPAKNPTDTVQLGFSPLNGKEDFRALVRAVKSKSFEEQEAMLPELLKHFRQSMGDIEGPERFLEIFDPNSEVTGGESFNLFWQTLSAADALLVIPILRGLGAGVKSLKESASTARVALSLRNRDKAAESVTLAVLDETDQLAKAQGIDKISAVNSALPFDPIDTGAVKGLSRDVTTRLRNFRETANAAGIKIQSLANQVTEMTPDQAKAQLVKQVNEAATKEGNLVLKTEVLEETPEGFKLRVVTADPRHRLPDQLLMKDPDIKRLVGELDDSDEFLPPLIEEQAIDYKFTWNTVSSTYEADSITPLAPLLSPSAKFSGDRLARMDVETSLRVDSITGAIRHELTKLLKEADSSIKTRNPLKKAKSRHKVSNVLAAGDEFTENGERIGKVWTYSDLKIKHGLDDQEIEAYFKYRTVFDHLGVLHNQTVRKELTSLGYKEVRLLDDKLLGKPYEDVKAAVQLEGVAKNRRAYVYNNSGDRSKAVTNLSPQKVREMYDEGHVLVRLRDKAVPFKDDTLDQFEYIFVKADDIFDLPQQVMNIHPGYVPMKYSRGAYFVRGELNDGISSSTKAVAVADNKEAALKYRDHLEEKFKDVEGFDNFKVLNDGEVNKLDLWDGGIGPSGSLYTSKRSKNPLQQITLDDAGNVVLNKAERVDPIQALRDQINSVSNSYPRADWKISMYNRIADYAKREGLPWNGDVNTPFPPTKAGKFAEELRKDYVRWMNLEDTGETVWRTVTQDMYEWALPKFGEKAANAAWWLRSKDPVSSMRAAAFHSYLGFFNPAQLWVQAQGASLAMSMNIFRPDKIATIFSDQLTLSVAMRVSDETLKTVAEKSGKNLDELIAMRDLYRKTGLQDSLHNTADYAVGEMGLGHGAASFKKVLEDGLVFYRTGEAFNRRFAFLTALDDFMTKSGKGVKEIVDADLPVIHARANDLMLGMSKSGAARWQQGALSVPTQFLQVQAKFLEQMVLPTSVGKFTPRERMKIMLGQMGLYGAAGVPLGDYFLRMYMDGTGKDQAWIEENPLKFEAAKNGMTQFLFSYMTGANVEIAERGAIANSMVEGFVDMMYGETPASEAAFGAFGSLFGRAYDATNKLAPIALTRFVNAELPTGADLAYAASEYGKLVSTFNNASKAYLMASEGVIRSRNGLPLVRDDFSTMEIIGAAAGFSHSKVKQYSDLNSINKDYDVFKRDTKNLVRSTILDYGRLLEDDKGLWSPEDVRRVESVLNFAMSRLNENDRRDLVKSIREEILNGETQFAKQMKKYLKNVYENGGNFGLNINATPLNLPDEEVK